MIYKNNYMIKCPRCNRKLIRVFHGEPDDELAIQSLSDEIIIGNCCESSYNYYCDNCDEFFQL